jgi:hypothetical protein
MTGSRAGATRVAVTIAIVLVTASCEGPSPDAAALADVISGAETAELNLEILPAGYHGPGSPAEVMQPVLDRVPAELTKYYVGTLLTRKVSQHQNGIRQMSEAGGGGRIGGVKTLALKDVRVSGATASVSAEVTVWFKSAQYWYQEVASQPRAATNVVDLDLHLVKDGGTWKIDQEHWHFAPGGGP